MTDLEETVRQFSAARERLALNRKEMSRQRDGLTALLKRLVEPPTLEDPNMWFGADGIGFEWMHKEYFVPINAIEVIRDLAKEEHNVEKTLGELGARLEKLGYGTLLTDEERDSARRGRYSI